MRVWRWLRSPALAVRRPAQRRWPALPAENPVEQPRGLPSALPRAVG